MFLEKRDIFRLGSAHSFYAKLPRVFVYDNPELDFSLHRGEVHMGNWVQRGLDLSMFLGQWVVTKTSIDGGSEKGPHNSPIGYPDGHHVYAKKVTKDFSGKRVLSPLEIDFYQSGSFTCMNPDIDSVGVWEGELK